MQNNPLTGAGYALTGLKLLNRSGLRRFVAIPLLINILLFGVATWWLWSQLQEGIIWVEDFLPDWLGWLGWILIPLFVATVALATYFTFTIVANLIGSPFFSLLAEKAELILTDQPLPPSGDDWVRLLKETPRAILVELGKMLYAIGWMIPVGILFFIPGINLLAPWIWIVLIAWLTALEFMDFPMGNHGFTGSRVRVELRRARFLSLGFGAAVLGMTMVPVLNFFALPAAVAGGTALWVEQLKDLPGRSSQNL